MFTGIIEEVGRIRAIERQAVSAQLTVAASRVLSDVHLGDSIAVNGVCLTVTSFGRDYFCADVMHETLNRSSLGALGVKSPVNLERAMRAGGRFGGHIVSGHIDGTGRIREVRRDGNAVWYTIQASEPILRLIVEKGSIAIDGISLTVARVDNVSFSVSIIPHTLQETALASKRAGDIVNLENDCIGKYVAKLMGLEEMNWERMPENAGKSKEKKTGGREPDAGKIGNSRTGGPSGGGLTREFLQRYGY